MLRPTYPIRTERLSLRPLTLADTEALLAYRSRPDVARYVPFEPMARELVEVRIVDRWAVTELARRPELDKALDYLRPGDELGHHVTRPARPVTAQPARPRRRPRQAQR